MTAPPAWVERDDGTVIARHVEIAETLGTRFMGLMGRSHLEPDHGLYLRPCNSIHMFFMRFPVDAVFVDREGRILRIYAGIKPWRMTGIVAKAKACYELPAGTCAAHSLAVGDVLRLRGGAS